MKTVRHCVAVLVLLGCGSGSTSTPPTPTTPPASVVRQIIPSTTDPGIDSNNDAHVAVNPSLEVLARGKLFVFLPGTGAVPIMQQLILGTAAARGYHALGLSYPNATAVGVLCADDIDPDCFWNVRREVIIGVNASDRIQITPANAITNRLEKLLRYLHTQYPTEGWGQFLVSGAVREQSPTDYACDPAAGRLLPRRDRRRCGHATRGVGHPVV